MGHFIATSKAEAGRKLASINEEIASFSKKLNCLDYIPLLLCLEDAINNFETSFLQAVMINEKFKDNKDLRLSISQFITEWYQIINELINEISDNGICLPSTVGELPKFGFGICLQKNLEDYLRELYEEKQIKKTDFIFSKPRLFLNKIPGWMVFSYNEEAHAHIEDKINKIFELRDLFYQKGLLETMIYVLPDGAKVEFDDTGLRKITLPEGLTVQSIWEEQGITPRMIETFTRVFDWNSFFRDTAIESLKTLELGKGKNNIENLKKEDEEIFNAYYTMENYIDTFYDFYEIEFEVFFNIISDIIYLCYNNIHTVGHWIYSEFFEEDVIKNEYNSDDLNKVIQLLSDPTKTTNRYDGLTIINRNIFTSFRRLSTAKIILLEKCFGEVYNNDLKGKIFEEACRKLLADKELKTFSDRINILEPTLPPEVSYELWGKQKQKTDIDVISSLNNNILIIECKEIKSIELKPKQIKQFKKYLIEHYYKTKWIASNLKKFERYMGAEITTILKIDIDKTIYIFPILVTNLLVNIEEMRVTPLITYLELEKVVSLKEWNLKNSDENSGSTELEINGRKISLPWLSCRYNS